MALLFVAKPVTWALGGSRLARWSAGEVRSVDERSAA